MLQKLKVTSYALIILLLLVLPSQAVAQCNTQEACEAAAQAIGLELGGSGYAFSGSYQTKGCYSYNGGKYNGKAYFGTGGSPAQMEAAPAAPKYRISCGPNAAQDVNPTVAPVNVADQNNSGAVCHPNASITARYNTKEHANYEKASRKCAPEGVNADTCATGWGKGRCQWGIPPVLGPLDISRSQIIANCKAAVKRKSQKSRSSWMMRTGMSEGLERYRKAEQWLANANAECEL